ncbi:MAG TPA: copper amine oxidase, partial [Thermoplasmatales archaeon]|nr:copper amine oxidase [Thermoplasmatales archaeon]
LLAIPVSVYEIDEDIKTQHGNYTGNIYGEFTFQGVYVYHLSLEDGFQLLGRITHMDNESYLKNGYYAPPSTSITRSLYIDNILYTISQSMVKLNSLDNLEELKHITLQ